MLESLSQTINTIGDVVRGNGENQQFLGSVMNTSGEVQQSVTWLLAFAHLFATVSDLSCSIYSTRWWLARSNPFHFESPFSIASSVICTRTMSVNP